MNHYLIILPSSLLAQVPPTSTGNGAVTSRDNPTWSARDNPTWSARDDGFCLTSDVSDSDTSPTKEQNKGELYGGVGKDI